MNRVLTAARLQFVHPLVVLGIPWLVVSISFAINWAVWALADLRDQPGAGFTGGVMALYITVMVVFVQSVTQLLPFAMGLSLSRRTFFTTTALVALVSAFGYGLALAGLAAIGDATDGWGVGLSFWAPIGMRADGLAMQALVSGAPMLALIAAGVGMGVVQKRWGPAGVWGLIIGSITVVGGLVVLVTWLRAWNEIGAWFTDRSLATLAIGLPTAVALVLAALAWGGLRRVVP
ncbi:hypothetical protein GCM10010531_33740 [Blastococcus jejuensis]|uniref:ABC-2 type transport system permease protein n=1 Tax=Blastococcus jejuensis TaxID=351224 RepID=A0ABP6PFP1_9ACTN